MELIKIQAQQECVQLFYINCNVYDQEICIYMENIIQSAEISRRTHERVGEREREGERQGAVLALQELY